MVQALPEVLQAPLRATQLLLVQLPLQQAGPPVVQARPSETQAEHVPLV
jgi:hypothetical protein